MCFIFSTRYTYILLKIFLSELQGPYCLLQYRRDITRMYIVTYREQRQIQREGE